MTRHFRFAGTLSLACALTARVVSGASDATMFRGNLLHTGVYDAPGVPELHGVKWKFKTGGRVYSSPAVAEGTVFVGSNDGNLYAVDAATGTQKWKFATKGEKRFAAKHIHGLLPESEPMPDPFDFYLSSPAVSNGVVYFGSGDGNVYALDADSGVLKWTFQTGDVVHASPALAEGRLFIGSWNVLLRPRCGERDREVAIQDRRRSGQPQPDGHSVVSRQRLWRTASCTSGAATRSSTHWTL